MTLIKVCGITNIEDAVECVRSGANFLGFIFAESPRQVDTQTVKNIKRIIGGDVKTVGVFTEESDNVRIIANECDLDYIQLHGDQTEAFAESLREDRVIRVARVRDETSIEALVNFKACRFYLLDTYKKGTAGGTGETFNWDLALRAKSLDKPLFLSGGLNPDNIVDAIRAVNPFAVDVSSGVESCPGKKDLVKVKEFIEHVREADNRA